MIYFKNIYIFIEIINEVPVLHAGRKISCNEFIMHHSMNSILFQNKTMSNDSEYKRENQYNDDWFCLISKKNKILFYFYSYLSGEII